MAKKKVKHTRYLSILFVLGSILLVGTIYLFNRSQLQDIRGRAEEDPNFCQNYCIGKDRCSQSSSNNPGDPNYNDPCCEEIKKTGSPYACPWPQRGYCTDEQCSTISGNRERCGGPRHSWCNKCIDAGCEGYSKNSTGIPIVPTSIIAVPTAVPIDDQPPPEGPFPTWPVPTTIPQPTNPYIPTQGAQPGNPRPQITYIPFVYPTGSPPPSLPPVTTVPAKSLFKVTLPNLLPAKESVEAFIQKTKFSLQDFLSKILP